MLIVALVFCVLSWGLPSPSRLAWDLQAPCVRLLIQDGSLMDVSEGSVMRMLTSTCWRVACAPPVAIFTSFYSYTMLQLLCHVSSTLGLSRTKLKMRYGLHFQKSLGFTHSFIHSFFHSTSTCLQSLE